MIDRILCSIELVGPLDEAQRKQLIEIARKCPVHRTLTNKIESAQSSLHPELQAYVDPILTQLRPCNILSWQKLNLPGCQFVDASDDAEFLIVDK